MPSIAINVTPYRTPSAARSLRPIQVSCSIVVASLHLVICRTSSAMLLVAWRRKLRPVSLDPLSLISHIWPQAMTQTVNSVCYFIRLVMSYMLDKLFLLYFQLAWFEPRGRWRRYFCLGVQLTDLPHANSSLLKVLEQTTQSILNTFSIFMEFQR